MIKKMSIIFNIVWLTDEQSVLNEACAAEAGCRLFSSSPMDSPGEKEYVKANGMLS
jgi:hypothetical protein